MGIDLQDTYGAKIRTAILTENTDKWYKVRDSVFKKVTKICPYYVIYVMPTVWSRAKFLTGHGKSLEAKWCEENLRGRFYGLIEQETKTGRREWLIRFELEEDAVHFKLRWL